MAQRVVIKQSELEELDKVLNIYSKYQDGKYWNDTLDHLYERVINALLIQYMTAGGEE